MLHGIDLASYQNKLISANNKWGNKYFDFAIIKATEGTSYCNSEGIKLASECEKIGYPYGLYHYARAEKNSAIEEAKHFLKYAEKYDHALYALDIEGQSLLNLKIDEWASEWLHTVYIITKKRPLLYISRSLTGKFKKVCDGNYGLWVAEWGVANLGNISPWKFWAIWQYDKCDSLNIDLNLFNGTEEMFRKYTEKI